MHADAGPAAKTADEARAAVYRAYVRAMLKRERTGILTRESPGKANRKSHTPKPYSHTDTVRWLRWLAAKMTERKQTVFLLERMGKAWFNRP